MPFPPRARRLGGRQPARPGLGPTALAQHRQHFLHRRDALGQVRNCSEAYQFVVIPEILDHPRDIPSNLRPLQSAGRCDQAADDGKAAVRTEPFGDLRVRRRAVGILLHRMVPGFYAGSVSPLSGRRVGLPAAPPWSTWRSSRIARRDVTPSGGEIMDRDRRFRRSLGAAPGCPAARVRVAWGIRRGAARASRPPRRGGGKVPGGAIMISMEIVVDCTAAMPPPPEGGSWIVVGGSGSGGSGGGLGRGLGVPGGLGGTGGLGMGGQGAGGHGNGPCPGPCPGPCHTGFNPLGSVAPSGSLATYRYRFASPAENPLGSWVVNLPMVGS